MAKHLNPLLVEAMKAGQNDILPTLPIIKVSPDRSYIAIENGANMLGAEHTWFIYSPTEGGHYVTDDEVADWQEHSLYFSTGT